MAKTVQTSGDGGGLTSSDNGGNAQVSMSTEGATTSNPKGGSHVATEEDAQAAQAEADKLAGKTPEGGEGEGTTDTGGEQKAGEGEAKEGDEGAGEDADATKEGEGEGDEAKPVELADPRLADAQKEWDETGAVSDATRDKIAKDLGVTREMVDFTIKGLEADFNANKNAVESQVNDIFTDFGGEENYRAFTTWAQDNLKPEQIEAYNKVEQQGDLKTLRVMAQGLKRDFDASGNGQRRDLNQEGKGADINGGAVTAFASEGEMLTAINDPRYESDSAYRKIVDRRIEAM